MVSETRLRQIERLQDSEDTDLDFTFFMTEIVPELIEEIRRLNDVLDETNIEIDTLRYEMEEMREQLE